MKIEKIEKVSNKYSIIKQVYEDRVLIRINNVIHSIKYNAFMFLLSNNSCIWTWHVADVVFGESQFEDTEHCYLVEVKREDFDRVKTYADNFKNFNISKEDEILSYEDLVRIAQQQENLRLVSHVY